MEIANNCPRCVEGLLKSWQELDYEQQEVVRRLPAATEYSKEERQVSHRWCTRCWFEATGHAAEA